jgi:hypothetical protein
MLIIFGMKDGSVEPYTLTVLLSCCYQSLERAVICFLQFVEVIYSIELLT